MRRTSFVIAAAMIAGGLASPRAAAAVQPLVLTCGTQITVAGSYKAQNSVHSCGNAVIVDIAADNVTLDLNQHVVGGDDVNCAEGIAVAPDKINATITNGTVRDCDDGVDAQDSGDGVVVSSIVATSNDRGIILQDRSKAVSNVVTNNTGGGIRGIGDFLTIVRNTVEGNGSTGITASEDNKINGNTVVGNGFGISVTDRNTISGNVVRGNGDGITIGQENRVIGNTVVANELTGIGSGGDSLVKDNVVKYNAGEGIRMSSEMRIIGNRVIGNGDDGIEVTVGDNTTTIKNNVANNNGALGIVTDPGVLGVGTNKAKGNGNPDECQPTNLCV